MICDISTFMHVPGSCYLFDFVDMPNVFMFILRGAEQGWHIHDEGLRTTAGAFGGVICKVYRGWSFPPKNAHTQKTPTLQNGINCAYQVEVFVSSSQKFCELQLNNNFASTSIPTAPMQWSIWLISQLYPFLKAFRFGTSSTPKVFHMKTKKQKGAQSSSVN